MSGTKMTLYSYSPATNDWTDFELVVTKEYLAECRGMFVTLPDPYEPGLGVLEVYFNGQHLSPGGGYEEVDNYTIRLDLGKYPDGTPVLLQEGDEIFVRNWMLKYSSSPTNDGARLSKLEQEIAKAREDKPQLRDRLLDIESRIKKVIVFVIPGGKSIKQGIQKVEIRFPFPGVIVDAYASCRVPGVGRTVIQVEKISQDDFDGLSSNPIGWVNIFSKNLILEPGEKSTRTTTEPFELANPLIVENDHFRINLIELAEGVEDFTIEITVAV